MGISDFHNLTVTALKTVFIPSSTNPTKMVKHIQTIGWLLPTNCLNTFDHFVGLARNVLRSMNQKQETETMKNSTANQRTGVYMKGTSVMKELTNSYCIALDFVNNEIPLKKRHLRANQVPYLTKELSKAIITRSKLKSIYLKTKAREDKKITLNKGITASKF